MQTLEFDQPCERVQHQYQESAEQLNLKHIDTIASHYMPFIKNGGLFIPTHKSYSLGVKVTVSVTLLEQSSNSQVTGTVIWITPITAQGQQLHGIGIQFEPNDAFKKQIDEILINRIDDKPTHTF